MGHHKLCNSQKFWKFDFFCTETKIRGHTVDQKLYSNKTTIIIRYFARCINKKFQLLAIMKRIEAK